MIGADWMGLRELRRLRVLSQQELARRAGVSKATIVNIEAARIHPHPATVRKLAAALDMEPVELAAQIEPPADTRPA